MYSQNPLSRRMMMTSGSTTHYKSMFDAGSQIIAKEGVKSLFKGAGYVLFLFSSAIRVLTSVLCVVPTFSVVLPVLVCSPSTTNSRRLCSARSTPVVRVTFCHCAYMLLTLVHRLWLSAFLCIHS